MTREEVINSREYKIARAACEWYENNTDGDCINAFEAGAMWADEHSQNPWHDAQGDILPDIDREVIVLCNNDHGGYKVCFGHRPYKKGYLGKSLVTGNVETFYPHTYGKGGWNIPDVKRWLDVKLPMEEQQ